MTANDLDTAYLEGRLTKRAYVRQVIDRGEDMTTALEWAETLVPTARPPGPTTAAGGDEGTPEFPEMAEGLDINFVGDGYVVYRAAHKRMHSLNHTAAVVLELCTGEHDVTSIAGLLQRSFDLEAPPVAETRQCLDSLRSEGLIR